MVDIEAELAQLAALDTRLRMLYAQLHAAGGTQTEELRDVVNVSLECDPGITFGGTQTEELRDVVNRRAALAVRLALAAMREQDAAGH